MPGVNTAEWLMAIDAHPETIDTELVVATAMATDGVLDNVEGLSPEDVANCVEELIAIGFLEPVFVTDHPSGEEHVLELRYPDSA
jgi:hypothetical protein